MPAKQPPPPEDTSIAEIVTITRAKPTPRPTRPPAPRPTPRVTPAPILTFAPIPSRAQAAPRAAAPVRHHIGGRAAAHVTHITPPHAVHATPGARSLAKNTGAGVNNGGAGSGAGPGTGDGGLAGSGSGLGGTGNGSGAGVAPCGVVYMDPIGLVLNKDGSRLRTIRLEVTLSDGSTVNDDLGWKFYYRRLIDDPFSKEGEDAGVLATLQLPPRGYDLDGRQTAATVFAVRHTYRDGLTMLEDCPK